MKKTIGLAVLMLTGVAAFAQPVKAEECYRPAYARQEKVVVRNEVRRDVRSDVRRENRDHNRRDAGVVMHREDGRR